MSKKEYNLHAGYYHNYTGICSDTDENLTTNEVVDLLNKKEERIKELEEENEQLKKENKSIQNKVRRLLNHLCDVEKCITKEQVKEWWNNEIGDIDD